jgi:hypothetical protein
LDCSTYIVGLLWKQDKLPNFFKFAISKARVVSDHNSLDGFKFCEAVSIGLKTQLQPGPKCGLSNVNGEVFSSPQRGGTLNLEKGRRQSWERPQRKGCSVWGLIMGTTQVLKVRGQVLITRKALVRVDQPVR